MKEVRAGRRREVLETRKIGIAGRTSNPCVRKVEQALQQDGVKEVEINRELAVVKVTFDRRRTNISALHDALLQSGYRPTAEAA